MAMPEKQLGRPYIPLHPVHGHLAFPLPDEWPRQAPDPFIHQTSTPISTFRSLPERIVYMSAFPFCTEDGSGWKQSV